MTNEDFGTLAICAERYALGRRTYMPSLVCNIIKRNLDLLDDRDRNVLIKDIEHPFSEGFCDKPYGDECDKAEWMELLRMLKKEQI